MALTMPPRVDSMAKLLALTILLIPSGLMGAAQSLTGYLASGTIPPGGTAQLQVFLTTPAALAGGSVQVQLDPAIFDTIVAADVYSATGDQAGSATIQGRTVDIEFGSGTAGVGMMPELPVFTITVPVLATAKPGSTYQMTVKQGSAPWTDLAKNQYTFSVTQGTFTVGSSGFSVSNVGIAGGLLPAGSLVEVDGTGFTAGMGVAIDGVPIGPVVLQGPTRLLVVLGTPTALDFRRFLVFNPSAPPVTFYPVMHGGTQAFGSAQVQPIFPLELYVGGGTGTDPVQTRVVGFQNPMANPVVMTTIATTVREEPIRASEYTFTIPAESTYLSTSIFSIDMLGSTEWSPSSPVRMVLALENSFSLLGGDPAPVTHLGVVPCNKTLDLTASVGGMPVSQQFITSGIGLPTPFTVSVATANGGNWLSATPESNTAITNFFAFCTSATTAQTITVTGNPAGLAAGTYQGMVTIMPMDINPQPTQMPITMTVTPQAQISASFGNFSAPLTLFLPGKSILLQPGNNPAVQVQVSSAKDPQPVTLAVSTATGADWMTVSPSSGMTPLTATLTLNTSAFPFSSDTGTLTIQGPADTLSIPVSANQNSSLTPGISALQFLVQQGTASTPQVTQILGAPAASGLTVTVKTSDGAPWLSAQQVSGTESVTVNVDTTGLTPGNYTGIVLVTAPGVTGIAEIPVSLMVLPATTPPVTLSPSSINITMGPYDTVLQQAVNVSVGNLPLSFSVGSATFDGGNWLKADGPSAGALLPYQLGLIEFRNSLAPETYTGIVTVASPAGSSNIASLLVTLTVEPGPLPNVPTQQQNIVPLAMHVLNGASQTVRAIAPGEIVTIFGQGIGPFIPASSVVGPDGKVAATLAGVQVSIGGFPAPLLYVSPTQVNAIVPYEVTGDSAAITVSYGGVTIPAGSYSVVAALPGVFTAGSLGIGQGAVLNQDGSVNSAANPAARGSTVQIFGTGGGATQPGSVTGSIVSNGANLAEPVTVTIGGASAVVTYAGSAPGEVAGLMQVNAVVPTGIPTGSVALILSAAGIASQGNVIIAVK
jgi:uncharacterized protein (TIGR03437 family)